MRHSACALLALALLFLPPARGAALEEKTVKATASWTGQGRFIPTGTDIVYFVGTLSGTVFVEDEGSILNGAKLLCLGTLEVQVPSAKQSGAGRCVVGDAKGNQVYAQWQCSGTHQVECKGPFTITGGSGRFKGITGQGELHLRSSIAEIAIGRPGVDNQETGAGLIEWPALRYRIP